MKFATEVSTQKVRQISFLYVNYNPSPTQSKNLNAISQIQFIVHPQKGEGVKNADLIKIHNFCLKHFLQCRFKKNNKNNVCDAVSLFYTLYEGVSKSFWTGCLKRELHMVQLSGTRCSCI